MNEINKLRMHLVKDIELTSERFKNHQEQIDNMNSIMKNILDVLEMLEKQIKKDNG